MQPGDTSQKAFFGPICSQVLEAFAGHSLLSSGTQTQTVVTLGRAHSISNSRFAARRAVLPGRERKAEADTHQVHSPRTLPSGLPRALASELGVPSACERAFSPYQASFGDYENSEGPLILTAAQGPPSGQ